MPPRSTRARFRLCGLDRQVGPVFGDNGVVEHDDARNGVEPSILEPLHQRRRIEAGKTASASMKNWTPVS